MPRPPSKRKEYLAAGVQDAIAKRRKASELMGEKLNVPKDDSLSIDAIAVPDTISSLHGKIRTPTATAIADAAATNTALPDVVKSLPPADLDADENTDAVMDTQSNYFPRASNPSTFMSRQGVKREAVIKTETTPAPTNTTTSAREIKREPVVKIVIAVPLSLSPSPQAEEIPAMKKPRDEEPLPTATDEAARKIASPDISEALPSPDSPPRCTATVNVSTRRRSRRQIQIQIQLELIETSETQPDDTDDNADYVDANGDLSGPAPPLPSAVNALTRRRSSRCVIPTSSTGTPVSPPTATMEASSRR
jgi:hypothetical protein